MRKQVVGILLGILCMAGAVCGFGTETAEASVLQEESPVAEQNEGTEKTDMPEQAEDAATAADAITAEDAAEEDAVDATGAETYGFWKYYTINNNSEVCIQEYTGAELSVTIPSAIGGKKVTKLGDSVFKGNEWLLSVTIPDTVKVIDGYWSWDGCFSGCKNLTTVLGMAGVTEIGGYTFYNCTSLTSVPLGNALQTIGSHVFTNCASLNIRSFPASLTYIGNYAFENTALTSVTLSTSVEVKEGAFYNCQKLASASINTYIPDHAFDSCHNLTSVSSVLEGIGYRAFYGCESLNRVTLTANNNVFCNIGEDAFRNCTSLASISVPGNVRNIYKSAFEGCTSLKGLALSHGLLGISKYAFWNTALSDPVISNSVVSIGENAFSGKSSVPNSITIPNSATDLYFGWGTGVCSKSTIIKGYDGSAAQKYAADHEFQFVQLTAVPSRSFRFSQSTLYLNENREQVLQLGYTITPANTTDAIVWTSSAPDIVPVNALGEITPKNVGSATIIAVTTSGIRTTMNVVVSAKPSKIELDRSDATIMMGTTLKLKATVRDRNGVRNDIIPTFSSSNTGIATVNGSGTVTGLREGVVTITAKTADLSATCKVSVVSNKPQRISFAKSKKTIIAGHTSTQKAVVMGTVGKLSAAKPTYSSSNKKVATVDSSGKVKGLKAGTVTIKAKFGGKTASYKVTVVTAKLSRKGKTLTIKTIPGAAVKVKASKKILGSSSKKTKANAKGVAKIKFKKNIKGVRVTVTVTKKGYKTQKVSKKY